MFGIAVGAREHAAVEGRRDARRDRRQDAAQVGVRLRLERRDRAVALRADLEVGDVVAAVRRGHVVLAPRLDPLDRPADLCGERGHEHVLVVEVDLRPEAAADVRRDAAHLRLGDAEDERGHQQAHDVRRLRGHPDRVLAGRRLVLRRRAAGLHRRRDQALVDEALLDHDLGLGQRLRRSPPRRRRTSP